jgi:hypothetical protein
MNAFVGDQNQFDRLVMVNLLPGSGAQIKGVVTRESLTNVVVAESVPVYVPQSFKFGGNVILVLKEQITQL